jgi:vacuolar-type H+-ATPase subunit D/Vma8
MSIIFLTAFEFTGLGRGGQQIQRAKEVYTKAIETLVELASLQVNVTYLLHHHHQNHLHTQLILDCLCHFG